MQQLFEFLPLLAFLLAYWRTDMRTAIVVLMVSMVLLVVGTWLAKRTVSRTLLASTALVVVLGAISVYLDNPLFFKWKPTALNWGLAVAFLVSQFIGERSLTQRIFDSVGNGDIRLSVPDWRRLNLMWVAFFLFSGAANIFVAYRYPEAVWVNFKVFGLMGLTVVFLGLVFWWLNLRGALAETTDSDKG
jgi:intracellular septation protein